MKMGINRRAFVTSMIAVAAARLVKAQLPPETANLWDAGDRLSLSSPAYAGGEPCALERIGLPGGVYAGAAYRGDDAKRFMAQEPARFAGYSVSTNVSAPDAVKLLTEAVKAGAHGFGEVKFHVEADGPEMRRLYAAAAELDVPVTIHFQEVPHTPTEGVFNTGFKRFDAILKQFPKTTFVGHCDAFWANVSADYANDKDYPRTPIVRGGITDKWLSDYPNLFADLSANSGNNALTRDPSFTADFLKRHKDKLFFGSDCSCSDGHGAGSRKEAIRVRRDLRANAWP